MSTPVSLHSADLRLALLLSMGLACLPACGDKEEDDDDTSASDTSDTDTTDTDTDTDSGTTGSLPAVPDGDYPECDDEAADSGWSGPCCVDVYCAAAQADGTCAESTDVSADALTGESLGSGSCQCDTIQGPFAPPAGATGACCYLVGIQGCTGRPMVVDGRLLRAGLVRGKRWGAASRA
jgi:hypothetical protein